jgi:cytidyltransferase-like protein
MSDKKVLVTGCFDMLHSGHIAFLTTAAELGDLYVCIGSDANVKQLKGRYPVTNEAERKYMLNALKCIKQVHINTGFGIIDFLQELNDIKPDIFVVNEDGHTPEKEAICRTRNIDYRICNRLPHEDLPVRSTTTLRTNTTIPFRIDLAGGWLDQPSVSKFASGSVITISVEPTIDFNHRSGMSTSTRNKAIELWKTHIPDGDPVQLAKMLFCFENPPGTKEVAGSQDALGIVMPGLNNLYYENNYWPATIITEHQEDILNWIEQHLCLLTLGPRVSSYSVLDNTNISTEGAKALANAAEDCWKAILNKDVVAFGKAFTASFEAQIAMFPNMVDASILDLITTYKDKNLGYKLSGAGGGGYLIMVTENPIPESIQIKIRRRGNV